MAAQAVPLQQYAIIGGVIATVALGIVVIVLVLSRRRRAGSSEELAQAIKDALTKP